MRMGIYLAAIGLVVPATASAQQFHPSMVEVGSVSPQEPHVTFNPPFPSTPQVALSIRDQNVGGTYRGCGVEAKNITATGFDYFPSCSARRPGGPLPVPPGLIATWIATLQQP
jgi:H-type lectin domain